MLDYETNDERHSSFQNTEDDRRYFGKVQLNNRTLIPFKSLGGVKNCNGREGGQVRKKNRI